MTMVKHTWYPGRDPISLTQALSSVLSDYDTGGIAEEALGVARQNSEAIANLIAALAEQGVITPGWALQICGAHFKYEVADAPADGA